MRGPFSKRWMVIAISLRFAGAVFALQRPRRGVGCEQLPRRHTGRVRRKIQGAGLQGGRVVRKMTVVLVDLLLLVKTDSPIRTLKDALDTARADPAKFNVGTINPGSTQNVTAELLRSATGIPMTIVPHRTSAEVLTSLLRGDTQIGVDSYA